MRRWVLAALLAACSNSKSGGGAGSSVPIPAGPRAECGPVAERLAQLELGNDAEPDARAAAVSRWRAACESNKLVADEAACIATATDTWSAAQCAPRMFPTLAGSSPSDCAPAIAKLRAAMTAQVKHLSDPKLAGWFDTTMKVMEQSCVEDHWPDAVKACILAHDIDVNAAAASLTACNAQMPAPLLQKLQARLVAAMPRP